MNGIVAQQSPNISLGSNETFGRTVRTGIQGAIAEGVIRLIEVVPQPDLVISTGDRSIITVVLLATVALIQNAIEHKRNQKFIGSSPVPPVNPPA